MCFQHRLLVGDLEFKEVRKEKPKYVRRRKLKEEEVQQKFAEQVAGKANDVQSQEV